MEEIQIQGDEDEATLEEELEQAIEQEIVSEESQPALSANDTRLGLACRIIRRLREDLDHLERLLASEAEPGDIEALLKKTQTSTGDAYAQSGDSKIVEGVFDGEHMIGSDGRQYVVPPNYASKSKLVEGDILKLTIQPNGTFLYKQIGPIERSRVVGTVLRDEMTSEWRVLALGRKYNVLPAALSYHKGDEGDEAVILIPKEAPSKWAAVENVIKRG